MLRIGLTGGIGSGKSTVASLFAGHGVPIVDTDLIARELVQPGMPAHAGIVSAFGTAALDTDGNLDRTAMRVRVFADPIERERLETILHPHIREETLHRLAGLNTPYALVVVPLLIESGFDALTDRILVVDCAEETQIERTAARSGMPASDVRAIMATQASRAQRLARADDVINNDKGPTELEPQVAQLHQRYLALARG